MTPTKLIPPGPYESGQEIVLRRYGQKSKKIRVKRWSIDFSQPIILERRGDRLNVYKFSGYWGGLASDAVAVFDWVRSEEVARA